MKERHQKRNENIRWFCAFTDATRHEIALHFALSKAQIYTICNGVRKEEILIPLAHRNEIEHKPVQATLYPVPRSNYSNRNPHPRNNCDYNLVPLNPAFGKRYESGVNP